MEPFTQAHNITPLVFSQRKEDGARLRSPLVILDGPRCSGKTTVAMRLVASLLELGWNATYFKKTVIKPDEFQNMMEHLRQWQEMVTDSGYGPSDVVVVDRFVASELVMALATGRTPAERVVQYCLKTADTMHKMYNAQAYILLPSMELIERRMAQRPEDHRWDMDPLRVEGLWTFASKLLYLPLEATDDQEQLHLSLRDRLVQPKRMPPPLAVNDPTRYVIPVDYSTQVTPRQPPPNLTEGNT